MRTDFLHVSDGTVSASAYGGDAARPITVALTLSLSWVGCNKSGKLEKASTFTAPSGPVELKLKWPVGERIVQSFDMKQNMEIFVPNQPNPIKQDMTMGQEYGLSVLKENPDGGHVVEMEFLSARMGMEMGGKAFNYDSTKKSVNDKADPATAAVQKMIFAAFASLRLCVKSKNYERILF